MRAGFISRVTELFPNNLSSHLPRLAGVALLLLALFAVSGCTAGSITAAATPPATSAEPAVRLTTDINVYSPTMSSAFGIHITARDAVGNAVKGNWTATWGQFCTATQDAEGGWKISDSRDTWQDASDIWWQFSTTPNPNGEMPSAVSIYFNGGGQSQTLLLEKCGPLTLKVSGTDTTWPAQSPSPAPTSK